MTDTDRADTNRTDINRTTVNRDTLKTLAAEEGLCISLYAPMHQAGKDTRENPIRFKNLLQEARRQLEATGFSADEIGKLLAEAEAKVDDYDFWQNQLSGLVAFIAPGKTEMLKLPAPVPELCTIGLHFHVGPLASVLSGDGRFYALELNLKGARLFEGSRDAWRELDLSDLDDVPTSLGEATRFDVHQTYQHQRDVSPGGAPGTQVAVHGHGDEDTKKADILYFFRQLENGVTKMISDNQAPLVVAGVDYLIPIYREANHYPYLHDEALTGSPEGWRDEELHQNVWRLLEPHFAEERERAQERFGTAQAAGKGSSKLEEVLSAALDGRIDTLLLKEGAHAWGGFDAETRRLRRDEADDVDNDDLLDLAASHTLLNGGKVYFVESLSKGGDLAAIYRY